jgi:sugar-specific transcriptional regulator TrmB
MSTQTDKLKNILHPFGLSEDESEIYLVLLHNGQLGALDVSRLTKIPRTRVYRNLDKLNQISLVSEKVSESGKKFLANSPKNLELIIKDKEVEIEKLKNSAPQIYSQLMSIASQAPVGSEVLFYRGIEGLKQINWNSTKTKGTFRIMELESMNLFLDRAFAEKVRQEFVNNRIEVHQLSNTVSISEHTNVKDATNFWKPKYIDPKKLKITFETFVYNDTYAMYYYTEENDVFGVEIINEQLAHQQKQIFDIVWRSAREMTVLNEKGRARVRK